MKKKQELEADLDPPNTRRTRPGSKIADVAIALAGKARPRKRAGAAPAARTGAATTPRKAKRKAAR